MIKTGHLQTYDIILTVQTPVHIGSGITVNKQEYVYDPRSKTVRIIDMDQFLQMLAEKELADEYENFIIRNTYPGGLKEFLESNSFTQSEIDKFVRYTCSVKDVFLETENQPTSNIAQFIRMKNGSPFVPGSSVKGAIRTCLFTTLYKGDVTGDSLIRDYSSNERSVEPNVFHTLNINTYRKQDAVNSIMRSVSISDSEPIGNDRMIICKKKDLRANGRFSEPNVLRECIKPGTEIRCKLTIDRSIEGLTAEEILHSVVSFFDFYRKTYLSFFYKPSSFFLPEGSQNLILGGGSGFFSKTVIYNLNDFEKAHAYVKGYLKKKFSKGRHDRDFKIAPHTLKCTEYQDSLMHFGVCKLEVK